MHLVVTQVIIGKLQHKCATFCSANFEQNDGAFMFEKYHSLTSWLEIFQHTAYGDRNDIIFRLSHRGWGTLFGNDELKS
jgi:hypothetical protein